MKYHLVVADLSQAIKMFPYDIEAHFYRGRAYQELQNLSEAIADFQVALTLTDNPEWIELINDELKELNASN